MDPRGAGSRAPWRLIALAAYLFTSGASGYGFFSFAPKLLAEYTSEGIVTLILLFQPVIIMFFSPVFGRMSDRRRNRKGLISTGFGLHLATYLSLQLLVWSGATSIVAFIAIYIARGLSIAIMACEGAWFTDHTFKPECTPAGRNKHTGISFYFTLTSVAWAAGSILVGALVEAFGVRQVGIICLVISLPGAIPLAFTTDGYARDRDARQHDSKPVAPFSIARDLRALDQGRLIYAAIGLRHFGLITALSIIAIVLSDIGLPEAVTGTIIALNPLFQILGMVLATTAIVKGARPLRLFSGGVLFSMLVVLSYALGEGLRSGALVAIGQSMVGFAWPFLIIGFEEHVVRNVDWYKRANYTALRETFMNLGKVAGLLVYYTGFELLGVDRLGIFTFLVFFPLAGFMLSIVASVRGGQHAPAPDQIEGT